MSRKCKVCGCILKETNYEKGLCDECKEPRSKERIIIISLCAMAVILFISLILACLSYMQPIVVIPIEYGIGIAVILIIWGVIDCLFNAMCTWNDALSIKNMTLFALGGILLLIIYLPFNTSGIFYDKYDLSKEILLEDNAGHITIDGTDYNLYKDKYQLRLDFKGCLVKKSNDDTNYFVKSNTLYKKLYTDNIIVFYDTLFTNENILYVTDDVYQKIELMDMSN